MKFYVLTEVPIQSLSKNNKNYPEFVLDDLLHEYSKVGSFCVCKKRMVNELKAQNPKLKYVYVITINSKKEGLNGSKD